MKKDEVTPQSCAANGKRCDEAVRYTAKGILLLVLLLGFIPASTVWGSPTGLNNIPTADVVPEYVLVLQGWGDFQKGAGPDFFTGFKYGPAKGVELGADKRVGSDGTGPLTMQAKFQIPVRAISEKIMPLVGVANVAADPDQAGKPDPYVVMTMDMGYGRITVGYSFQKDNDAIFGGLDKTLKLIGRDLVLRTDIRQVDDGDELLMSAGFLYELPYNFILEMWGSLPTAKGVGQSLVTKLNYVVKF